jgi:hypothetical protein
MIQPQNHRRTSRHRRSSSAWEKASDEELLSMRLCDLDLKLEGSVLVQRVEQLYEELSARGIRFRPHVWVSDEWFSPDGVPGIAVPFYVLHPRLIRLERRQLGVAEGASHDHCMQLIRHETAHALDHAYHLNRRKRWRALFGKSSTRYPRRYQPNPFSRDFVQYLEHWYAQCHPDEDFAETFAVWLTPGSNWARRYADWPALRKLEYVDELMHEIARQRPKVRSRTKIDPIHRLRTTLGEVYRRRKARGVYLPPEVYDRDLRCVFADRASEAGQQRASAFLHQHLRNIRRRIPEWSGDWRYHFDEVFYEMLGRCRALKLCVGGDPERLQQRFAALLRREVRRPRQRRLRNVPV